MSAFKERINQLRAESGIKQSELAKRLDITSQALSYIMHGREPKYDMLIKIAKIFNVSSDYLLGLSEYKNDNEKEQFINKSEMMIQEASQLSIAELDLFQDISRIIMSCVIEYKDDTVLRKSVLDAVKELLGEISILAHQVNLAINEKDKFQDVKEDGEYVAKKYLAMILARFSLWQRIGNQHLVDIYRLYENKLSNSIPDIFLPSGLEIEVSLEELTKTLFGSMNIDDRQNKDGDTDGNSN